MLKNYKFSEKQLPFITEICREIADNVTLRIRDRDLFYHMYTQLKNGEACYLLLNEIDVNLILDKISHMSLHPVRTELANYMKQKLKEDIFI